MRLDEIDHRIVRALASQGRASYATIGKAVSLSAPAVKRRVDRLRADGVITGFTVRVDPHAFGWTTEAYVELYCAGRTSQADILRVVEHHPEIVAASTVSGDADALLHVFAPDLRHFERVLSEVAAEPFVTRTRSILVLSPLLRRQQAPDVP